MCVCVIRTYLQMELDRRLIPFPLSRALSLIRNWLHRPLINFTNTNDLIKITWINLFILLTFFYLNMLLLPYLKFHTFVCYIHFCWFFSFYNLYSWFMNGALFCSLSLYTHIKCWIERHHLNIRMFCIAFRLSFNWAQIYIQHSSFTQGSTFILPLQIIYGIGTIIIIKKKRE